MAGGTLRSKAQGIEYLGIQQFLSGLFLVFGRQCKQPRHKQRTACRSMDVVGVAERPNDLGNVRLPNQDRLQNGSRHREAQLCHAVFE